MNNEDYLEGIHLQRLHGLPQLSGGLGLLPAIVIATWVGDGKPLSDDTNYKVTFSDGTTRIMKKPEITAYENRADYPKDAEPDVKGVGMAMLALYGFSLAGGIIGALWLGKKGESTGGIIGLGVLGWIGGGFVGGFVGVLAAGAIVASSNSK